MRFAELLPRAGCKRSLECNVEQLAEGLVRLGVDTDVIRAPPALGARARRLTIRRYDLVDVHGLDALSAFARAPIPTRRLVLTPHQTQAGAPIWRRVMRWPFAVSADALVALAHTVICSSAGEARLVARSTPPVVDRIHLVPEGVDRRCSRSSKYFDRPPPPGSGSGRIGARGGPAGSSPWAGPGVSDPGAAGISNLWYR
jgi:hypothetical protein